MVSQLSKVALATVSSNIIATDKTRYIVAGGNQFKTLWTRDFCYSVKGLLNSGFQDLVKSQLQLIYKFRDSGNLLPRGLDVIPPQRRVVINLTFPGLFDLSYPEKEEMLQLRIQPEYLGEHGTIPFDSNVLFVLAYLDYVDVSQDQFLSVKEIEDLLLAYKKFCKEGLFYQPPFADWQDSVKREEPMLLFHVLLIAALKKIKELFNVEIPYFNKLNLEQVVLDNFFDKESQLFFQDCRKVRTALDVYGVLFRYKLFSDKVNYSDVYSALKNHDLWCRSMIPGQPVSKTYDSDQVSWTTKVVGLQHYHDNLFWGWLVAESYKICKIMKDESEAERIITIFSEHLKNAEYISEVYCVKNKKIQVFNNLLYKSECPFTWSGAKWLEALAY
jgi:glycogen debranching enzyme